MAALASWFNTAPHAYAGVPPPLTHAPAAFCRHGGNPGGANLGNAIFWMQDTFKLVKQHDLNFSHLLGARAQTDASKWYFGSPQVIFLIMDADSKSDAPSASSSPLPSSRVVFGGRLVNWHSDV